MKVTRTLARGVIGAFIFLTTIFVNIAVAADSTTTTSSDSGGSFNFITPFLNVGLIGVLLLMFVLRKGIVPEWVLKQAEERHQRELSAKDADITELKRLVAESTKMYNDQVVPAFTRSIDVNREYVELLRRQNDTPEHRAPNRRKATGG